MKKLFFVLFFFIPLKGVSGVFGNGGLWSFELDAECGLNICEARAGSFGIGFGATRRFIPGFLFKWSGLFYGGGMNNFSGGYLMFGAGGGGDLFIPLSHWREGSSGAKILPIPSI